jgi:hypothetical protein
MDLHVISLVYAGNDPGVSWQGVGTTLEAAIAHLNKQLDTEWSERYSCEERDEFGFCMFDLDGAWTSDEPTEPELPFADPAPTDRIVDVGNQLNRWLQATMDAFVADYTVHSDFALA